MNAVAWTSFLGGAAFSGALAFLWIAYSVRNFYRRVEQAEADEKEAWRQGHGSISRKTAPPPS